MCTFQNRDGKVLPVNSSGGDIPSRGPHEPEVGEEAVGCRKQVLLAVSAVGGGQVETVVVSQRGPGRLYTERLSRLHFART